MKCSSSLVKSLLTCLLTMLALAAVPATGFGQDPFQAPEIKKVEKTTRADFL